MTSYPNSTEYKEVPGMQRRYSIPGSCKDIAMSVSVCLSLHYFRNHMFKLLQIFGTCYLWQWLGPPLFALPCWDVLSTSGFVDDVIFAHNRPGKGDEATEVVYASRIDSTKAGSWRL